jgi:dTDP-glucose 4,6-dehydratase
VSDLVEGIYRLLMADESEAVAEPVNLGNPHEMSILEFAQAVVSMTGNTTEITFHEDKRIPGDPQTRQPDVSRAKTLLDWEPQVSLEEGLARTIEYFKDRV